MNFCNGTAEFAPHELLLADQVMLDHPPIALAVVKGFLAVEQLVDPTTPYPTINERPEINTPQPASELTDLVNRWLESNFPPLKHLVTSFRRQDDLIRAKGIAPHTDCSFKLPLYDIGPTYSLRIDNNFAASRTVRALRPARPIISPTGKFHRRNWDRIGEAKQHFDSSQPAQVQQQPGDLVIFMDFPYPTLHAVETSPGETLATLYYHRLNNLRTPIYLRNL